MHSLQRLRCTLALAALGIALSGAAQPPPAASPPSPRAAAQVDLTGNWVAQVTEDWRWRMITPPKGDFTSVPLNVRGRQVASEWDPARDAASGEACRAFGAGGLLRQPTRLKISWQDDATLMLETDAGQQVRRFHFATPAAPLEAPSWQGHSVAEWTREPPPGNPFGPLVAPTQEATTARAGGQPAGPPPAARARAAPAGALKAVTTNLRPGYLRKNGVPYSEQAVVTEYFDRVTLFGTDYLNIVTIVDDPVYLTTPFVVSQHFKREPDGSRWNPTPCATDAPLGAFRPPVLVL